MNVSSVEMYAPSSKWTSSPIVICIGIPVHENANTMITNKLQSKKLEFTSFYFSIEP